MIWHNIAYESAAFLTFSLIESEGFGTRKWPIYCFWLNEMRNFAFWPKNKWQVCTTCLYGTNMI